MNLEFDWGSDAARVLGPRDATVNEARYVVAELADAGSYMISMGHRVEGELDVDRLRRAFAGVVARHEALRTGFGLNGTSLEAWVHQSPRFRFNHIATSEMDFDAFRDWALPRVFDDVRPGAPESLVRLLVAETPDYWRFTVAMHHAVSDGFSRGVVNRELLKLYAGEELPDAGSYSQYISTPTPVSDTEVARYLETLSNPALIPPDGSIDAHADTRGEFLEISMEDLGPLLRRVSKECGASKFGMLGAVYALGLGAFTGTANLSTFFQSEGRKTLGAPNSVVGPFSNTLPLDLSFDPAMPFGNLARDISSRVQASLALETAPLVERAVTLGKAPNVSLNMFPPAPRIQAGDLVVGPREFLDRRTEFDLNLVWSEDSGVTYARAFYDSAKISGERAAQFLALQERLIEDALAAPYLSCGELLRRSQERAPAKISMAPSPKPEGRIHDAFFAKSLEQPQAVAIITSSHELTYRELRNEALAYTNSLQRAGASPGETVAIIAERGKDFVASILGISVFGSPFVVIDGEYPTDRILSILKSAETRYAFQTGQMDHKGLGLVVDLLSPTNGDIADRSFVPGESRDVAYHLFTSGTTGEPKRISHPDATLMRFIRWQIENLGPDPIRTLLLAGLSHDPVMRDIFLPLSTGGAIIIPGKDEIRDPRSLRRLLEDARPDTLHITPASGRLIAMGAQEDLEFSSVRQIYWGGDRTETSQVARWRKLAPQARQFNLYGTTETPQAALIHEIIEDAGALRIPVGHPPPWKGVRLEENGSPVSYGAIGEIVVELSDPVLGARDGGDDCGPKLIHRTGDYGFMLPQSGVYLVGRRDNQVKVNALRIELSEITSQAERLDGVRQAATVQMANGNRDLVLFAVADSGLTEGRLRAALERALPRYMVPARVVLLDEFPLTKNGKIDLQALSARELDDTSKSRNYTPPETPEEHRLVEIWESLLGLSPISVTDSFLDIGGDSLTAIRLMLEMERSGMPESSVKAILQGATIRELASGQMQKADADGPQGIPSGGFLSRTSLHALRGLLVCLLVAGHWMPGLLARVPALAPLDTVLRPLLQISTPGFAIIFGASLGYFKFELYKNSPNVVKKQMLIGGAILFAGMFLASLIGLLSALAVGDRITWHYFFMTYYNVLGFYLLAILSVPLWFWFMERTPQPWQGLAVLITSFACLDLVARWALLEHDPQGFLQLMRLYATAKFSYFNLGVGALLGIAAGLAIRRYPDLPLQPRFAVFAAGLVLAGSIWAYSLGELGTLLEPATRIYYWKWCLYLGVVLLLAAAFWRAISLIGLGRGAWSFPVKLLVSIGVLALPMFVFHRLILSLKTLTEAIGISDLVGLAMVLSFFVLVATFAVRRIWRLNFS